MEPRPTSIRCLAPLSATLRPLGDGLGRDVVVWSLEHVRNAVGVGVAGVGFGDAPVAAVSQSQDDGGEQCRQQGAGEDADLDVLGAQRVGAEGELADKKRDGEADTGE